MKKNRKLISVSVPEKNMWAYVNMVDDRRSDPAPRGNRR